MTHHHHNNHGTLKSYILGFILSIILTIVPYMIVVNSSFSTAAMILIVIGVALLQLLVQLVFFLHLSTSASSRDNLLSFIFTFLIVAILVLGSLWIMYHMNVNMMLH